MTRDWRDAALCAQVDLDLFFPEPCVTGQEAKAVCQRCEVRMECLEEAVSAGIEYGIWGGMSERARRPLVAARRRMLRAAGEQEVA